MNPGASNIQFFSERCRLFPQGRSNSARRVATESARSAIHASKPSGPVWAKRTKVRIQSCPRAETFCSRWLSNSECEKMTCSTPWCQVGSFRRICLSDLARNSTYLSTEEPAVPNNSGNAKTSMDRPVIAITAGDVAGIGPEVILRACLGSKSTAFCTPVLVGHPQVFREAAGLIGHELRLVEIPSESVTAGSLRHQARVACLQHQLPCLNPCGDEGRSFRKF